MVTAASLSPQPIRRSDRRSALFLLAALAALLSATAGPASAAAPFQPIGPLAGAHLVPVLQLPATPTSITHAGDSLIYVTLRTGPIRILQNGRLRPVPFLDLTGRLGLSGEEGLLSAAFHPHFAENGFFFVDYNDPDGTTVIARYRRSANNPFLADPASATVLLRIEQPFDNHKGGQLQFGPDGYLYIGMGDGGAGGDPFCNAQSPGTLLGKILRIDVDHTQGGLPYAIPPDNPFRGPDGIRDEIWARGVRNPWRYGFDRANGNLWIADVGQGEREEVDFVPRGTPNGLNFGWKTMEGSLCFGSDACPPNTPPCGSPQLFLPILEYGHTGGKCSITGGYVYRGADLPAFAGRYFFGDFCSGEVWAAAATPPFAVRLLADAAPNLVTFGEDVRGEIYLGTLSGQLLRLARGEGVGAFVGAAANFSLRNAPAAGPVNLSFHLGQPPDDALAVAGDWDGDGRTGVGIYVRSAGRFLLQNVAGVTPNLSLPLGPANTEWIPIAGDWDGDGRDGLALYDRATGLFHVKERAAAGAFDRTLRYGPLGRNWIPLAGDWDGDGRDGIGLYDPATGVFRLRQTASAGPAQLTFRFGALHRIPVAGDWDGDGKDGIGAFDPATGRFVLRNVAGAGAADLDFLFGPKRASAQPIGGVW
ncbi:MAG TPA: PQQ-dependent sugar dehydrogenase [Thermoanaerobaculia bacterium]|nr:PQQ-dependent sugar dehydrogenase [Thermoanaerobaculia bacterium]